MCTLCFTSLYASCRTLGFWSFDTKKFSHISQIDSVNKKSCTLIPKSFDSSIYAVFLLKWGPHVICKMFQQLGCPHQVIWELSLWARCRLLLLEGYSAERKVVYHLPMEHNFLDHSIGKFLGAMEHLKRKSCFSGWYIPNRNPCSISSKPSLILGSGLRGCFLVNGTDLYQC